MEESTLDLSQLNRLTSAEYDVPCLQLARSLLGCVMVRRTQDGEYLSGRIVETEAYPGNTDQASHSFNGRRTQRNGAMFMEPGTSYVYSIYGVYYCVNVSSREEGGAVLLRALEPKSGISRMSANRLRNRRVTATTSASRQRGMAEKDLCNGPSKLCQALVITKELDRVDMKTSETIYIVRSEHTPPPVDVVVSTRIGIDGAGPHCASLPYRFYVDSSRCVSVRERKRKMKA